MWIGVIARFSAFQENLRLTTNQRLEGQRHHAGVRQSLNRHYYGSSSETANSFLIGSWAKFTRTRPPRDIDLYFVLPNSMYWRYNAYQGNKQSALLQEVKKALQSTYPNTDLRGDGQVVVVGFNRMSVEVVPAFLLDNGQYLICDTHHGGRYNVSDPKAELSFIENVNRNCNKNLCPLIMMMKSWQEQCNVPLKSFLIELVAAEFLQQCRWANCGYYYYDWIMRDFFLYLYWKANGIVIVPGTNETIQLGDHWKSRTKTAYDRAVKACEYEKEDYVHLAGEEWQKIFGEQIPRAV